MQKLQEFKVKIDQEITKYFDQLIKKTKAKDRLMVETLQYVKKMVLAKGKRIRPALMFYGYLAAGGKDEKRILQAAVSIELIHIFLLIHDDIADRGEKRHGVDTLHIWFQKMGQKLFSGKDQAHFGNSMALIAGDLISASGNEIILNSGFDSKLIEKALLKLQEIISLTIIGEAKDIFIEYRGKATEKEILEMYELKTARYTFEGPLHLGAILGGGNQKLMDTLTKYAVPLGIAFQIQDDILGVFGSEAKMGKSSASDIEEGKQTILVAKAMENGTEKQKKRLLQILGKKNLSGGEIKEFQNIIRETGALEYARQMAEKLIAKGQRETERMKINPRAKDFLKELADFLENREV
jgi:geranylgeranyl diphosphate synthase type I